MLVQCTEAGIKDQIIEGCVTRRVNQASLNKWRTRSDCEFCVCVCLQCLDRDKKLDRPNGFCDLCFFCEKQTCRPFLKCTKNRDMFWAGRSLSEPQRKQSGQFSEWEISGIIKEKEWMKEKIKRKELGFGDVSLWSQVSEPRLLPRLGLPLPFLLSFSSSPILFPGGFLLLFRLSSCQDFLHWSAIPTQVPGKITWLRHPLFPSTKGREFSHVL